MKEEIWKEIEGYNGDYLISNHGRVKSFKGKSKKGKILKTWKSNSGYLRICLKNKKFSIHRLVAESFIKNSNPNIFNEVNHIDENKENNYFENLEWCDRQYNIEYSKSKSYKILFPDGHEEIIFNLNKFCKNYNLNLGSVSKSIKTGGFVKKYKILETIEKDGKVKKMKKTYKPFYKILGPNNNIEIIDNLSKFCKNNNLKSTSLSQTFNRGTMYKGFKIVEKMDKNGILKKAKNIKNKKIKYTILYMNGHKEIIFNFSKFCQKNNLTRYLLYQTLKENKFYKGFKLIEIINKDKIITKL
jgi:hypothetical protein